MGTSTLIIYGQLLDTVHPYVNQVTYSILHIVMCHTIVLSFLSHHCTDNPLNKSDNEQAVGYPQHGLSTRDDDYDNDNILVMMEGLLVALVECVGCCCHCRKNIFALVQEQIVQMTIPLSL
jgi:hypothetical protein